MSFLNDRIALIAGAVLWVVALILGFSFNHPNALQEQLIRGTFALGAGGIASVIPGLLNVQIGGGGKLAISAAGALAVYLLSYIVVPGQGIGNLVGGG